MHQSWALPIKDPTIDHYRLFYFIGLKKVSYLQYRTLYDGRPGPYTDYQTKNYYRTCLSDCRS
jgi:hypothetical protein